MYFPRAYSEKLHPAASAHARPTTASAAPSTPPGRPRCTAAPIYSRRRRMIDGHRAGFLRSPRLHSPRRSGQGWVYLHVYICTRCPVSIFSSGSQPSYTTDHSENFSCRGPPRYANDSFFSFCLYKHFSYTIF